MENIESLADRPEPSEHRVTLGKARNLVTFVVRVGDLGPGVPVILTSGDGFKSRRGGRTIADAEAVLAQVIAKLTADGWTVVRETNTLPGGTK